MPADISKENSGDMNQTDKYLTFILADEEYGLEILKVREIIGILKITSVPKIPDYVKGVINLRGVIIPVIDLRLKFGIAEAEYTQETCIIVVNVEIKKKEVLMGIIVDTVNEVLDISADNVEEAPSFGGSVETEYILGMGKVKNSVKILLDIDKVLSSKELLAISKLQQE